MAENAILDLHRAHRELQTKYTYFLLAAAGAAIGLAVNQTRGVSIAWSQVPLGMAVGSWGLSFVAGCSRISHVSLGLSGNIEVLRLGSDSPSGKALSNAMHVFSEKASRAWNLQFRLLIAGAVLYVVWHVLEMYLRRFPSPVLG